MTKERDNAVIKYEKLYEIFNHLKIDCENPEQFRINFETINLELKNVKK